MIVRGVKMMLISLGVMLLAWAALVWLFEPDGLRLFDPNGLQKTTHERQAPRDGKGSRYY